MKVTRIDLNLASFGEQIAFGTVEFDGVLVVKVRLYSSAKGPFMKLGESKKGKDEKWYDSAYVTDNKFREDITKQVIEKYNEVLQGAKLEQPAAKEA